MATAATSTTDQAQNGAGTEQTEVRNPATGEVIGSVPRLTPEQVGELVAKARAAQPGWEALGFSGRGRTFKQAKQWLIDNRERMAETIISETGKTYEDAGLELAVAIESFGFWAKQAKHYLEDERVRTRSPMLLGRKIVVRHEPLGVVGVIGPWNYPLVNAFCDAVPALMAGNSVILKPSSDTPFTSILTEEMMRECGLPENVLAVATGGRVTAEALIDGSDFIMFTGSTETGRSVMERAAKSLTQVSLELGGKDPMIVLSDANLERAANGAAYYSMLNSGQVCISAERAYVEEPVYDRFVEMVTERVKNLRQGTPGGPGSVEVGAITTPSQVDLIEAHVKDAVDKGARITTGGHRGDGPGDFFEPTVIADADHTMTCMMEETFGPTLPIMKVRDAEEAVRMANDSPFGLQGSVWTADKRRGEELARQVEAGTVLVNDAMINYAAFGAPMSGWKESGVSGRHGANGIRKYCKTQTIVTNRFPMKRDMFMMPYTEKTTRMLNRVTELVHSRRRYRR
jgi:acyl-CoA reductase-like NAD-dependent aldehyde dehydrogenase